MTCTEVRNAIDPLLDGELEPAEEQAVRGHLSACAACARELEERRAFHETLSESFERGLDGVEATSEERERAVERMAAAARRRSALLPRLAAAAVLGIAVGLVAWSLAAPRPSAEQIALAARIGEARKGEAQVRLARQDADEALRFIQTTLDAPPAEDPRLDALRVAVVNIQEAPAAKLSLERLVTDTKSADPRVRTAAQRGLWRLGPESLEELRRASAKVENADWNLVTQVLEGLRWRGRPEAAGTLATVTRTVEGTPVTVTQWGDGRVQLVLPGIKVETGSMGELFEKHPDLCRKFAIGGGEGSLRVGDSSAGVDLQGRLQLLLRTGGFDPDVLGEAWRDWSRRGGRDPKSSESRWKNIEDQWHSAARPVLAPAVDVEEILKSVKSLTRQEIDKTRAEVEARMKKLQEELKKAHDFRTQARILRAYAEDVGKEK